jgi:hypothetical protein
MAQTTVAINLEAKTKGTDSVKSLKAQIKEATNEAIALSQKFGEFSPEALKAAQRVAELKDQMGDFKQRVEALNPDKFDAISKVVGGVASGFAAAQGAMALFGAESEDVEKAMLKVQGAMAFAQGIQGVLDARNQFVALGKSAVASFRAMSAASKAFMIGGIGLLIAGIAAAVAYWDEFKVAVGLANKEMEFSEEQMKNISESVAKQTTEVNLLTKTVTDQNKTEAERRKALDQLKEKYPTYFANLTTDINDTTKLLEQKEKLIDTLIREARVRAAQEEIEKIAAENIAERTRLNKQLAETQGQFNKALEDEIANIPKDIDAKKLRLATEEEFDAALKNNSKSLQQSNKQFQQRVQLQNKVAEIQQKINDLNAKENEKAKVYIGVIDEETAAIERNGGASEVKAIKVEKADKKEEEVKKKALTREQLFNKLINESAKQREANDKTIEEENKKRLEQKQRVETAMREYRIEKAFEEVEINKKLAAEQIELEKQKAEAIKQAQQQSIQLTAQGFASIAELADAFAGKSEEQQRKAFEIKKQASIAQAIVETIGAAQSAYASQMAIKTPDAPIRAAVAAALALAAGVARVRKIEQTPFEAKGVDTAGGGATPPAPTFTPITGGTLPDEQQFGGMGRVYVLEGDITKTQTRVRRLRNTSVV